MVIAVPAHMALARQTGSSGGSLIDLDLGMLCPVVLIVKGFLDLGLPLVETVSAQWVLIRVLFYAGFAAVLPTLVTGAVLSHV